VIPAPRPLRTRVVLIAPYDGRVDLVGNPKLNAPGTLLEWSSVNRLTGQGRRIATAEAGLTALDGTSRSQVRVDEWGLGS
jgi:hypothetical protein